MFAIAVALCGGGLVLVKCTFRMRIETLCSLCGGGLVLVKCHCSGVVRRGFGASEVHI